MLSTIQELVVTVIQVSVFMTCFHIVILGIPSEIIRFLKRFLKIRYLKKIGKYNELTYESRIIIEGFVYKIMDSRNDSNNFWVEFTKSFYSDNACIYRVNMVLMNVDLGNLLNNEIDLILTVAHEMGHRYYRISKFRRGFIVKLNLVNRFRDKLEEYKADFLAVYFTRKYYAKYYFGAATLSWVKSNIFGIGGFFGIFSIIDEHPEALCRIIFAFISEVICAVIVKK